MGIRVDKKKIIFTGIVIFISFGIAYFIDKYYIEGKGIMFLFELFKL